MGVDHIVIKQIIIILTPRVIDWLTVDIISWDLRLWHYLSNDTLETTSPAPRLLLKSTFLLEVKKESCFSCFGERPSKSLHHPPPMNTNSMRVAVVLVGNWLNIFVFHLSHHPSWMSSFICMIQRSISSFSHSCVMKLGIRSEEVNKRYPKSKYL